MKYNRDLIVKCFLIICTLSVCTGSSFANENIPDINTILMRSTFKIIGSNNTIGTVFILGQPIINKKAAYVLVTAAHVLEGIKGDTASLLLRRKVGNKYTKFTHTLQIRDHNKPLWVAHASADVAAMHISLPEDTDILLASSDLLVTDNILEKYEIYPGRELKVVGFPFGLESNELGFPVLRSGNIASFPITPSLELKTFLMDFKVFGGNSGGPVYFHDPDWHKRRSGAITAPVEVQMLIGLVSKQKIITEKVNSYMEEVTRNHPTDLAEIVHAALIKETIEQLPDISK